jgi:hypothetical protein
VDDSTNPLRDLPERPVDPTRQSDQAALTTSHGTIWLVVGGISALVSLGVLIPMVIAGLPPHPVALIAAIIVALSYAGMIVARLAARPGRTRLTILLVLMLVLVGVALVGCLVVAAASAGSAT